MRDVSSSDSTWSGVAHVALRLCLAWASSLLCIACMSDAQWDIAHYCSGSTYDAHLCAEAGRRSQAEKDRQKQQQSAWQAGTSSTGAPGVSPGQTAWRRSVGQEFADRRAKPVDSGSRLSGMANLWCEVPDFGDRKPIRSADNVRVVDVVDDETVRVQWYWIVDDGPVDMLYRVSEWSSSERRLTPATKPHEDFWYPTKLVVDDDGSIMMSKGDYITRWVPCPDAG